jgi:branched-chain amino acid transport system ATP-binding protein
MLNVENVTMRFGGLAAVNNVSLNVESNKISGLIGPNGAGKTTFFNLISGVCKPNEGTITFNGERIDGKRCYQINEAGIARTYQVINLFRKMEVIENVMVGMHSRLNAGYFSSLFRTKAQRKEEQEALDRAYEWLDFVKMKDKAHDEAGSLAYGEQRLLEIVRALASNPKLLLLDEPAAGMNNFEKVQLDILLKKILKKNVTILIIEHDMKLMMGIAEQIFVLNYGKKLAEGSPEIIQKNPDVINAYLGGD